MRRTVTQFACESVGLCSFCGPYMREFEFSHSNPVSRIIKISYAHNLQVNKLDFSFYDSYVKEHEFFTLEDLLK